jgi:hypothetical protein
VPLDRVGGLVAGGKGGGEPDEAVRVLAWEEEGTDEIVARGVLGGAGFAVGGEGTSGEGAVAAGGWADVGGQAWQGLSGERMTCPFTIY